MKNVVISFTAKFRSTVIFAGVALSCFSAAQAATDTWAGTNGTLWTTAGDFTPTAPASGDALIYTGTAANLTSNNNETAGFLVGGITFTNTAAAYTITGNAFKLTAGIVDSSANTQTISAPVTVNGSYVFNNNGGPTGSLVLGSFTEGGNFTSTFNGTGAYTIGNITSPASTNQVLTFNNSNDVTLNGTITQPSSSLALNFNNSGNTVLSGNVGGGIGGGNTGTITETFTGSNNATLSGNIVTNNDTGSGAVNLTFGSTPTAATPAGVTPYTGTATISGNNHFFGVVTVNSGKVVLGSATALGSAVLPTLVNGTYNGVSLMLNGGILDLNGNDTAVRNLFSTAPLTSSYTPIGGTIVNNGSSLATFTDESQGQTVFGGVIADGTAQTAVTFSSATYQNITTLTNNNTYTGATVINANSQVSLGAEASLIYGLNPAQYTTGSIANSGAITVNGGSYGTNGTASQVAGGILDFARSDDVTYSNPISGSGRLYFQGTGNTTLNGTNTFHGAFMVGGGTATLDFSGPNAPSNGTNVIDNGFASTIPGGVTTNGTTTVSLTGSYQLGNSAAPNYVPIAVGDYIFAQGVVNFITAVDTVHNTFTLASAATGAHTGSPAVILLPDQVSTGATITAGTVTGVDTTQLEKGELFAMTVNGVTTTGLITNIISSGPSGSFTVSVNTTGTGATFDFSNNQLNAVYLGNVIGTSQLNPTATTFNTGDANLDVKGGDGGVSTQTIGILSLTGGGSSTQLGGANGSFASASNVSLIAGTNGNSLVLNIGEITGGAGGGSSLNFNLGANTTVTLADPYFNAGDTSNGFVTPFINGREEITLNNNDFAVVDTRTGDLVGLSTLTSTGSTTGSNYFAYAYQNLGAGTNNYTGTLNSTDSTIDVKTGGGTGTITLNTNGTAASANAYRFNENADDTLNFSETGATGLNPSVFINNILVTSAVGHHTSRITGSPIYFGQNSGRIAEIFQNNPDGLLEIDANMVATTSSVAKSGQGTLLVTGTNALATFAAEQGTTIITGNVVAPSFLTANTATTSNVITFTTPGAAANLYIGESLSTGGFITAIDAVNNTATLSQNLPATQSGGYLNFVGGSGLVANGAAVQIANGATVQFGNGTASGNLMANSVVSNNGALVFDWSGAGNAGNNFNTFSNAINGIGSLTTEVVGSTTVLLGNNTYGGGTTVGAGTTLVVHQAVAATGAITATYTSGSNVVTVSDATNLRVGQTLTSGDLTGSPTILAINGNTVYLSTAATASGTGISTNTGAFGTTALANSVGNRDANLGTLGTNTGFGVTVNGAVGGVGGVLDLGGYNLNSGAAAVDSFTIGSLTLNGGTVQNGLLSAYFGYNIYSGTEAATTSWANAYNGYTQGLTKSTDGTAYLNALNTYNLNPTTISGGILNFATNGTNFNGGVASGIGALSNAAVNLVLDGGTLQYTGTTVVLSSDGTTAGSSTNPLLNTNGTATSVQTSDRLFTITQNGGTIDSSATYAIQFTNTGADVSSGSGARTLTLTGSNIGSATTGTTSIASLLADASGAGNTLALSKTGIGTWSLLNNNTYSGGTTVSQGILAANNVVPASGTASATGSGLVTVLNGGAVGGGAGANNVATAPLISYGPASGAFHATLQNYTSGKVGSMRSVEITAGGILNPGNNNAVGTLTTAMLTMDMGSLMTYDFGAAANSLVAVTGIDGLTLNGGLLTLLNEGGVTPFDQVGIYNIFSYTGTIQGAGVSSLTANLTPGTYTFIDDTADHLVQLDITSVPEPTTWLMMVGGLGLLVMVRRSKSRRDGI